MHRLIGHVRGNVVAYLALFMATTGTALAAGPLIITDSSQVADNTITSGHIIDKTINGSFDIRNGTIQSPAFFPGAVNRRAIAASAVGTDEIADGSVGTTDLASDAVTNAELADGSVGYREIQNGAVGRTQLGSGAVGSSQLGPLVDVLGGVQRYNGTGSYTFAVSDACRGQGTLLAAAWDITSNAGNDAEVRAVRYLGGNTVQLQIFADSGTFGSTKGTVRINGHCLAGDDRP